MVATTPSATAAKVVAPPSPSAENFSKQLKLDDFLPIKGGKPTAVRPKFNAAANPKPLPKAKPPTVAKPLQAPSSITGRTLPQRTHSLKLPKQTQALTKKPAVSAAARKLNTAVKPTARALATKPITSAGIQQTRDSLREKSHYHLPRKQRCEILRLM